MTTLQNIQSLLNEKRYDLVETAWLDALKDPAKESEKLLAIVRGLARAGQKTKLQALMGSAETGLKAHPKSPALAALRWTLLKEAVKAGATPSTTEGFHKLFEEALGAAYPESPSLLALLGRFKFREAKEPLDGLARLERAEKWLPFEVGRCFSMPGRGAGRVVETNFALDSVRLDFEKVKGVAIPIGVASKSLVALPEGHFLRDKLSDPATLSAFVKKDPAAGLKRLLDSYGRPMTLAEVKECIVGLVAEGDWQSYWTAAKKSPQVVTHGSGKTATVEWSDSADAADDMLYAKFAKAPVKEKIELFRKHAKRSPELTTRMAENLFDATKDLPKTDPSRGFEVAVLVEKSVAGGSEALAALVPDEPLPLLARLADRAARERLLEVFLEKKSPRTGQVLADWFFKEEDSRTLDFLDKRLLEVDPDARERMLDRLLKSPRSGPRAFVWFCQKATADEELRKRLTPNVLGRLLDAISWDELGAARSKVREMFDRTGLAAIWIMKHATLGDVRVFLEALGRHNELEPRRRDALVSTSEMKFPDLRKQTDDQFFVTPESLERKRKELEQILQIDIPENTKGIALAAAEGDLSENFEYKARRDKQQLLSARAGKLQEELALARVLDPATIDTTEVRPGTKLTLSMKSGGTRTLTLLGPWDSKPEEGIYSYLSDLGKALLGKLTGEEVDVLGEAAVLEKIEPFRPA